MDTRTRTFNSETPSSPSDAIFRGIVVTFIMQTAITTALGLIGNSMGHNANMFFEHLLLTSFLVTSGTGFFILVRDCRPLERVLIAMGYFPLMLFGYWFTGLMILLSLPGAHDSL